MPSYKLTYFGGKGNAEPIRYLLAHGNHQFEDIRIAHQDWPAKRDAYPMKKLPVLECDGKTYIQSLAICRYLAKPQGLAGNNEEENLLIDSTVDTVCDFRNSCASYFWDPMPASKEAKKSSLQNETVPTYMDHLEKQAKENGGFLALKRLTWADVHFAGSIDYLSHMCALDLTEGRPTLKAIIEKVNNLPGIKEYIAKRPKTDF